MLLSKRPGLIFQRWWLSRIVLYWPLIQKMPRESLRKFYTGRWLLDFIYSFLPPFFFAFLLFYDIRLSHSFQMKGLFLLVAMVSNWKCHFLSKGRFSSKPNKTIQSGFFLLSLSLSLSLSLYLSIYLSLSHVNMIT